MARLFDDVGNDVLNVASASVTAVPLTLACWFMSDDLTIAQTLISLSSTPASTAHVFNLVARGNIAGDPVGAVTNGGSAYVADTTTGYSANVWHHACGVFTAANSRTAYIDGGSSATDVNSTTPSGINNTRIGRSGRQQLSMSGRIAEAGIWSVALTGGEIAALAGGVNPRRIRPQSLVMYVPCYGVGSPEPDYTAGQRHMTVTGATQTDHCRVSPVWGMWAGWRGAFAVAADVLPPHMRLRQNSWAGYRM